MTVTKILIIGSLVLFAVIGVVGGVKKLSLRSLHKPPRAMQPLPVESVAIPTPLTTQPISLKGDIPQVDRIYQLFTTGATKLPIVETVTYESRVPWLKGRPAWIADYATHYKTSTHFIARSLNGKPDYQTQRVISGSQFNVFRKDRNIQFYLLVDVSLCKMAFYYIDLDTNERLLLKIYPVGLGKTTTSGCLTPIGKYTLGNKIAVYKPGMMGLFHNQSVEMIQVFGTRWIPFELIGDQGSVTPIKGLGIHGAPWDVEPSTHRLVERRDSIGQHVSDGCLSLTLEDMEELFAIVVTKPTTVEITKNFKDARLPGVEVASPIRQ